MLTGIAAALLPMAAWCAATDIGALLGRLARPAPATTPFVEVRFSPLLERPIVVAGELAYRGPGALARQIDAPFRERTEIRGDTVHVEREGERPRRFSLRRAPELRSLLASFSALLGGDRAALEREFSPDLLGDERSWQLVLTPRDARLRQRVPSIVITGSGGEPRCITASEAGGGASVMLVGPATGVTLPPDLDRAWLAAHCRDEAP